MKFIKFIAVSMFFIGSLAQAATRIYPTDQAASKACKKGRITPHYQWDWDKGWFVFKGWICVKETLAPGHGGKGGAPGGGTGGGDGGTGGGDGGTGGGDGGTGGGDGGTGGGTGGGDGGTGGGDTGF